LSPRIIVKILQYSGRSKPHEGFIPAAERRGSGALKVFGRGSVAAGWRCSSLFWQTEFAAWAHSPHFRKKRAFCVIIQADQFFCQSST
jgi:hypothetical protein